MNDIFERRVQAAAVAAWWTLLFAAVFLSLQWVIYLLVMSAQPAWLLTLWGPDIAWHTVQRVWFWGVAIFKLCLWFLALLALWLTLWARQLRKQEPRA